ncbi:MAG: AAA family ATPase [Aristaeellaceae bacterium]
MPHYDYHDLLPHIDPARCPYDAWLDVGFAIHHEGGSWQEWDEWSRRDPARYHEGECQRKFRSFGRGGARPVTLGTLVALARQQGWEPPYAGRELGWDDTITDDLVVLDQTLVEPREIREPADWNPRQQLIRYLEALFDATDKVSYVTRVWEKDGSYMPSKGASDRTAGDLIQKLNRCQDISDVIGTVNEDAGAWIRFNPMDGNDVRNDNVTAYNYALVESDSQDIERQYALLTELQLPIRILVHSGGKSLHAIVRIEAGSYEEYRSRVDYLYAVCRKNGLEIDPKNRNPSRLSRMPGVMRKGRKQYIVAENMGFDSFTAWKEWVESTTDDLPEFESFSSFYDNLPPLSGTLIEGLLRQGHKMLITGPSKAGKSFALIQLTIAIAEGLPWMGMPCLKGKVLYVNLELDRASCLHRFREVYDAMGVRPTGLQNISIWNLRGKSLPMDKLAPRMIRRARKEGYLAVIIDPIYKILTGDENSAEQMSQFCNQFDKVCTELGTAVIYCHHHSKGAQGGKRAQDRGSGSGVFARDPDAILDMIQLELTDSARQFLKDSAAREAMARVLDEEKPRWREAVSQDDQCSRLRMELYAGQALHGEAFARLREAAGQAEAAAVKVTAWRLESTLREFAPMAPLNVWFDYPLHRADDTGVLSDMDAEAAAPPWQKGAKARKKAAAAKFSDSAAKFADAVNAASAGQPPTVSELAEYLSVSAKTVYRYIKQYGYKLDKNTGKVSASPEQTAT